MSHRKASSLILAFLLVAVAVFRAANAQDSQGVQLTDSQLGITLTLPAGFESHPEIAKLQEDVHYVYVRPPEVEGEFAEIFSMEVLPGMISRGGFRDEQIERLKKTLGPGTEHFVAKWQGFDLDAFSAPSTVDGFDVITFHVQVPIRRRALQLHFVGPRKKAGLMKAKFQRILFDLKGESNWSEEEATTRMPPASNAYINTLFAIAIGAMLIGLIALMIGSKWLPKGGVLVIAIAIYWASWQLPNDPIRELKLLTGCLRMFGCIAGLLGIVDLIRKRKPKAIAAQADTQSKDAAIPPIVENF